MSTSVTLWDETEKAKVIAALERMPIDPLRPPRLRLIPYAEPVTRRQRGYYRGVVLPALCDYTGYEEQEMHEILLWGFADTAGYRVAEDYADLRQFEILNQAHMREFLDIVLRWAAIVIECYIPSPGEQLRAAA